MEDERKEEVKELKAVCTEMETDDRVDVHGNIVIPTSRGKCYSIERSTAMFNYKAEFCCGCLFVFWS